MKGDKMAKRSSIGSIVRKRLSDITNALPQPKSPAILEKPSSGDASSTKAYIENLTKENLSLVKAIQDKNKLIELSGIELQKLRVNLQKMQLQNWNLAQANSQMVAELNFGKEKLKSLQHEVSCKEALLKAKNMEFKSFDLAAQEQAMLQKAKFQQYATHVELEMKNLSNFQMPRLEEPLQLYLHFTDDGKVTHADSKANEDGKPNASNRRQRFTRSRSMGSSMSQQVVTGRETVESKRRCLRRQSSNSKIQQQQETTENLFEVEGIKLSPDAETMQIDAPTTTSPATVKGAGVLAKDEKHDSGIHSKRPERTSIGRPLRKAVEKVHTYKEIPLNSKMRRKG